MTPLPILYVHGSADVYGSDKLLLELATGLDRTRYEPIVVVPTEGPLVSALKEREVDVHVRGLSVLHRHVSPGYWLRLVGRLPASVRALQKLMDQRGVQLVHTNTSHVYDGALAARAAGVAHVWHVREVHTGLSVIGGPLSRMIYHYSDAVIVMSDAVKEAFFSDRPDKTRKIHKIYDGVSVDRFHPGNTGSQMRTEIGLASDTPLVGVVGRIAHWKGHRLFLHAAARVVQRSPNVHFVVVGDAVTAGDCQVREDLLKLVEHLGLEDAVTFTGVRADVPQVMAALDVLVLPSELPEPWGMVVLEAMATARPVVATRQGGPLEAVVEGETGYLVPPDNVATMAQAILRLLEAPEEALAMGSSARLRCEQCFSQARTHEEIVELYEAVLNNRGEETRR